MICLDATMWHAASFCWDSWYAPMGLGRWAGESSRCEDPAPTVGIAGYIAAGHHLRPCGHPRGRRRGG